MCPEIHLSSGDPVAKKTDKGPSSRKPTVLNRDRHLTIKQVIQMWVRAREGNPRTQERITDVLVLSEGSHRVSTKNM
jgi:hypothetical protein